MSGYLDRVAAQAAGLDEGAAVPAALELRPRSRFEPMEPEAPDLPALVETETLGEANPAPVPTAARATMPPASADLSPDLPERRPDVLGVIARKPASRPLPDAPSAPPPKQQADLPILGDQPSATHDPRPKPGDLGRAETTAVSDPAEAPHPDTRAEAGRSPDRTEPPPQPAEPERVEDMPHEQGQGARPAAPELPPTPAPVTEPNAPQITIGRIDVTIISPRTAPQRATLHKADPPPRADPPPTFPASVAPEGGPVGTVGFDGYAARRRGRLR